MHITPLKGAAIAAALSTMLLGGSAHADAQTQKAGTKHVKCEGSNDCKGKGNCKSASNDCKGKNDCKGHSFTMEKSKKACAKRGGTIASAAEQK